MTVNKPHIDIGTGLDNCPSCESDSWKSAKMVVMEGTTYSNGTISGDLTDPGKLSGGIREFLLSDRWFSWSQKLDADVNFSTSSGLVENVKKFMIAQGGMVQMPTRPDEPQKPKGIGFFERISPIKPSPPPKPRLPNLPQEKPWYTYFFKSMKNLTIATLVIMAISMFTGFSYGLLFAAAIFLIGIPTNLISSFSGNKKAQDDYTEELAAYYKATQEQEGTDKKHKEALRQYQLECEKAEAQKKQEEQLNAKYQQELSKYKSDLKKFEDETNRVLLVRELLWEKAHICMRCGSAYLGSP